MIFSHRRRRAPFPSSASAFFFFWAAPETKAKRILGYGTFPALFAVAGKPNEKRWKCRERERERKAVDGIAGLRWVMVAVDGYFVPVTFHVTF